MLRRLPKDLPLFGALLLGLSLMAFGYAAMYVDLWIGRPSSTAALGLLFVPIWSVLAAVVGMILGFVARAAWRRLRSPTDPERKTWALLVTLGCVVAVSAGAGVLDVIQNEQEAKPHVRVNSGVLVREFRADAEKPLRISNSLYDLDHKLSQLSWGSNKSELLFEDDRVVLRDTVTGKNVEFRISALDYINRVDAVPVSIASGQSLLAVAISGRATGRRAVVAVIDENYNVIFEEQVERFWELRDTPIEVRVGTAAAFEYVVFGPRCDKSLILRPKDAA